MSQRPNPTFVLVPGSFSPPTVYEKLIPLLEASGHEVHAIALVSANSEGKREKPATMQDDAAFIRTLLSRLIDEGKDVVLVMNSYGGYPGTEAAKGLGKEERKGDGEKGGVVALVYVAGWMPPVGKHIFELHGEPELAKNAGEYTYLPEGMHTIIFPDLPEKEALKYVSQFENQSSAVWYGVLTYPGYKFISTTCIIPDNDLIIPTAVQMEQVAREVAEGVTIKALVVQSGHVPMLSIPEKVAEILLDVAKDV